jgi:hypothetical protein
MHLDVDQVLADVLVGVLMHEALQFRVERRERLARLLFKRREPGFGK